MTDLQKLIEAAEAGEATTMKFYDALSGHECDAAELAYHGSLDAFVWLLEGLLPGWDYRMETGKLGCKVWVSPRGSISWGWPSSDNEPARAGLLAILKAKASRGV